MQTGCRRRAGRKNRVSQRRRMHFLSEGAQCAVHPTRSGRVTDPLRPSSPVLQDAFPETMRHVAVSKAVPCPAPPEPRVLGAGCRPGSLLTSHLQELSDSPWEQS